MMKKGVVNPGLIFIILLIVIIVLANNNSKPTASVEKETIIKEQIIVEPDEETETYTCSSSDGMDVYVSGYCEDSFHQLGYQESCAGNVAVVEYYCNSENICESTIMGCPGGTLCLNGGCV